MIPAKGKKLLPRIARHLQANQLLQIICLLVACFSQFDVVRSAAVLDAQVDSPERREVELQTDLFLSTVLQCILPVISQFNLSVASGMMGLMMEHGDMGLIVHSRVSIHILICLSAITHSILILLQPGQALLTAFLSRAEVIKSEAIAGSLEPSDIPTEADLSSWYVIRFKPDGLILSSYLTQARIDQPSLPHLCPLPSPSLPFNAHPKSPNLHRRTHRGG